jgi:hypothetical protein
MDRELTNKGSQFVHHVSENDMACPKLKEVLTAVKAAS